MKTRLLSTALLVVAIGAAGFLSAHEAKTGAAKKAPGLVMLNPEDMKWVDAPPSMPPGAKVAVLEGDPSKPGYFAMRIKAPGGYRFMPHWHPNVERFTVLSGTFHLGLGDRFTETGARAMTAGSYATLQPKVHHYGWTEGDTELHLTTLGPWKRVYVNPADDPSKK